MQSPKLQAVSVLYCGGRHRHYVVREVGGKVDDSNSVRLDKVPHSVMQGLEVLPMVWEDEAADTRTRSLGRNTTAPQKMVRCKSS